MRTESLLQGFWPHTHEGRAVRRLTWLLPRILLGSLALSVAILIGLRISGDAVKGAPYFRAYLARGLCFAVVVTAICFPASWALIGRTRALNYRLAFLGLFVLAASFHVAMTLGLARTFDEQILRQAGREMSSIGFVEIHYPDSQPLLVRRRSDGSYEHREHLQQLTQRELELLLVAEDERFLARTVGIDIRAIGRALKTRLVDHRLQGGSGLNAQLAGMLLGLQPRGSWVEALRLKMWKTLAGCRVDDLLERRQMVNLYLTIAPFGSLQGHEVVGFAAAARAFYGVNHRQLSAAQQVELLSRLRDPSLYFPYRKPGEDDEQYRRRLQKLQIRFQAILGRAQALGVLVPAERQLAQQQFLQELRSREEVLLYLRRPRLAVSWEEIRERVPDVTERPVRVIVAADGTVQALLENCVVEGLNQIRAIAPTRWHRGDDLVADALVMEPDGALVAEVGLTTIADGMASNIKPELYLLALETGVLPSMRHMVMGKPPMAADAALIRSHNPTAQELARRVGLARLERFLRQQGYAVTGPYLPIALGAGVSASPRTVAGSFAKFAYDKPLGLRVQPRLIDRIEDAATGATLYEPAGRVESRPAQTAQVRAVLEKVSLMGTARALASLAEEAPIAAKTGTAGFLKRGRWQGRGGSWLVAADSLTRWIVVVRVRWKSGAPFELEGSRSAALIVREFLTVAREYKKLRDNRRQRNDTSFAKTAASPGVGGGLIVRARTGEL